MRRFLTAVAFLTALPLRHGSPDDATDVGRATLFFPVVGALLGSAQVMVIGLLALAGTPPELQAVLSTVGLLLLAGGLHQDALADMVDGFGGGRTRADVLRIMQDSRVGAFGAMALVLALGTRVLAVANLIVVEDGWRWIIVAAAVSRCSTWVAWFLPYARQGEPGVGNAVTDHVGSVEVVGGTVLASVLAFGFVGGTPALLAFGVAGAAFAHNGLVCRRRIGGVTGDTLGAATETAEVLVLAAAAIVVQP